MVERRGRCLLKEGVMTRTSQTKPRIQEEEKPRIQEEKLDLKKTRPGRRFRLQAAVLPRWSRYYRAKAAVLPRRTRYYRTTVIPYLLPRLLPRATERIQ